MLKRTALPALLFALGCTAQSADAPTEALRDSDDVVPAVALTSTEVEGQQLYQAMCWACHGRAGRGDGPGAAADADVAPPDFHAGGYADLSAAEIQERVRSALDGNDPSHPHMQKVAPLLETERFMAALAFVPKLAYPSEIPGSALVGQSIFLERCAPCHGESADGRGSVAGMLQVPAADLRSDPFVAEHDFDGVFQLIKGGGNASVHGSSMPSWGALFDDGTIWDLVAYLATLQPGVLEMPGM